MYKGHFYAEYGTNERRDGMFDEMEWPDLGKRTLTPILTKSMILADDLILASDGARLLYLVEPNPLTFKQLASARVVSRSSSRQKDDTLFAIDGKNQNWATQGFLRTESYL